MLNIEKYKDEIKKLIIENDMLPGMSKDGKPMECRGEAGCKECRFTTDDGLCDGDARFIDWCLEDDGLKEDCKDCKHNGTITCNDCSHSHKSMFERKPKKTRQSEFLKMFPNAKIHEHGFVEVLPCYLNKSMRTLNEDGICEGIDRYKMGCKDCRTAYWNEEVE